MRHWRKIVRGTEATEIAEAALVLPLLFTLLLGIFWLGRVYNIYAAMNHAAREGARAAAGYCCATCGGGSSTCGSTPNGNFGYSANNIAQLIVGPILSVSRIDTTRVTSVSPPPNVLACGPASNPLQCTQSSTSPTITVCQNASIGVPSYSPAACGTAVYFQYPVSFPIPYTPSSVTSITLTGEAIASQEQ